MNTADQILNAALSEFYEHGFHATGVDQLSASAGVTKRTLYRHFPSKEALIEAVLQTRDEQFVGRMRAFIEVYPVEIRPCAYLDFLAAWGQESDFHGCMFINAAAEYAATSATPHIQAKAHKTRILEYLKQICREANVTESDQFALQLFLVGEGLIVSTQVGGYDEKIFQVAHQIMHIK